MKNLGKYKFYKKMFQIKVIKFKMILKAFQNTTIKFFLFKYSLRYELMKFT